MRYPMTDGGIRGFIRALCPADSDVRLEMAGPMEDLKHQDYHGKRVRLRITDSAGTSMETKRDLANARNNWLGANVDKVVAGILRYFGLVHGEAAGGMG